MSIIGSATQIKKPRTNGAMEIQMNDIILAQSNELTMSSREIAELTGKDHGHVFRDTGLMLLQLGEESTGYIQQWTHPQNRQKYNEYLLPKDLTLTLVSGYNVKLRKAIIDKWIYLESKDKPQTPALPQNYLEALEQLVTKEKQLIEQAPKIAYLDKVIATTNGFTTTEIASELSMSAIKLNRTLKEMNVQRKIGGRWVLTAGNLGHGLTTERAHVDDSGKSRHSMLWTEKGRMFVNDLFKGE